MRKISSKRIDIFFALASFAVFATSMLVILLFSASIYKNIVEKSQDGLDERICSSYIWSKVKTCDTSGKVYAGEFCGLPALYLEEEYDSIIYTTTIYLYDGWVRELFYETGLEFYPEDGLPVIEADQLSFEQVENGLIRAIVNSEHMYIFPRVKA